MHLRLCLPGESMASFMKGVRELMLLLQGAPLVAREIGGCTGELAIETEEMVIETPTITFDDSLETRIFHLLLTIFYYEGNKFEEAFEFARQASIGAFGLAVRMQRTLPEAPEPFPLPLLLEARVSPERKALIETRIATFGEHPSGLGKFTRSMFAHDLRRKVSVLGAAA